MQLQFVIALKALWHAMTGSHLECMGCQLFMKEKKESFFFRIKLIQLQFKIAFKHYGIQWLEAILNLWGANSSWKKQLNWIFLTV